jgi:hypothetical protein
VKHKTISVRRNSSKPHNPDRHINARETLQKANYTVENIITNYTVENIITNYTVENIITNYTVENFIIMIEITTPLKNKTAIAANSSNLYNPDKQNNIYFH